ncbi:MAG: methyltransferase domain-containing protein [Patescibacteria group bacterium]
MFESNNAEKPAEKHREQSTRKYEPSPELMTIGRTEPIIDCLITKDTHVLLIGDGQGLDTKQILANGADPVKVASVNYEQSEVDEANRDALKSGLVKMRQGDATNIESLHAAGIGDESQEVVIMLHVLETPAINGDTERQLVQNLARILKSGGEAILTQYKRKLAPEQAQRIGVQEIREEDLQAKYGASWCEVFRKETGKAWLPGMRFSELSNIRTKNELQALFQKDFDVRIDETGHEYIIRLRKKSLTSSSNQS